MRIHNGNWPRPAQKRTGAASEKLAALLGLIAGLIIMLGVFAAVGACK